MTLARVGSSPGEVNGAMAMRLRVAGSKRPLLIALPAELLAQLASGAMVFASTAIRLTSALRRAPVLPKSRGGPSWSEPMNEERKDLLMQVEGMTCQGCVEAVKKTIARLDPQANVQVDLDHGRVAVTTRAQSLDVAQALTKAGYTATAMTG